jgi:hypothetical protein
MRKIPHHRRLVFLILIAPLFAICLCVTLLIPSIYNFFNSAAFPDYLWSQRITRDLNDKGYSVHDFVNVSRSEIPPITLIAVGVSNVVEGKQIEPYALVKDVHSIITEAYTNTSPQPQPVEIIAVLVYGIPRDPYAIEANFEDVRRFQAGEISEQEYFKRWILHPDTLEIAPP